MRARRARASALKALLPRDRIARVATRVPRPGASDDVAADLVRLVRYRRIARHDVLVVALTTACRVGGDASGPDSTAASYPVAGGVRL